VYFEFLSSKSTTPWTIKNIKKLDPGILDSKVVVWELNLLSQFDRPWEW
jgi:hypothetical protein